MKDIIFRYLEGRANNADQLKLLAWLRHRDNRTVFNSHKLDWINSLDNQAIPEGSEKSWNSIQDHLMQKSYNRWQSSRKINLFLRYAAIFFFVISLGSVIYYASSEMKPKNKLYTKVLANNGQISKVVLPDSSIIWLNSGSEISYNNSFSEENRDIELIGEAYFQVTKNEDIPLIVTCGEMQVKVLGTRFNVAAYPSLGRVDVVLESGKVELLNKKNHTFSYQLKPGEHAKFDLNKRKLTVISVNTSKYTSWKKGMINIYNQNIDEVLRRLEVRYNQKFKFDPELSKYTFTFTIKNDSLDDIIKIMEKIAPVKAIQVDDIIYMKLDDKKRKLVDVN